MKKNKIEQGLISHRDFTRAEAQKGTVAVPQGGLIHLAAKGVEKTTSDLSHSLLTLLLFSTHQRKRKEAAEGKVKVEFSRSTM